MAAAFDRPEQVIEIGAVVQIFDVPVQSLELELRVEAVLEAHVIERRDAETRINLIELQRVFPVEEPAG